MGRSIVGWLFLAVLTGCSTVNYMPVQVTLTDARTGKPMPGVKVGVTYDEAAGQDHGKPSSFAADRWQVTDANGTAIVPVTVDHWVSSWGPDGTLGSYRAIPHLVIESDQLVLVDQGTRTPSVPLSVEQLRQATGITDASNPFPVSLQACEYSAITGPDGNIDSSRVVMSQAVPTEK